jgi:hypothetical protein
MFVLETGINFLLKAGVAKSLNIFFKGFLHRAGRAGTVKVPVIGFPGFCLNAAGCC